MAKREIDAKSTVCPLKFGLTALGGGGTTVTQHVNRNCIARACAMWQPSEPEMETYVIPSNVLTPQPPPGEGWTLRGLQDGRTAYQRVTHYCGDCRFKA